MTADHIYYKINLSYNSQNFQGEDLMPFVNVNTNTSITKEQETAVKTRLGSAIENLGKTESWLMIGFHSDMPMYFKGDDAPCAFVDISVFGQSTDAQCEK